MERMYKEKRKPCYWVSIHEVEVGSSIWIMRGLWRRSICGGGGSGGGSATMGSSGDGDEIKMSSTSALSASAFSKDAFAILVMLTIRITTEHKRKSVNFQ